MKAEQLKLYNKYKDINHPNWEIFYIGIDKFNRYTFLRKMFNDKIAFITLKYNGFDPEQIAKDLNLEIIDFYGNNFIISYTNDFYSKEHIEKYFQPNLKDKLNKIINR